ncbi:succinate dehydrogenase, membrane subunit, putative [Chloroherpeton thalassium ATCC 35110]|uniref:Succinate dehydrogenase, membrane subunit, putative n=1 Tax=Chloroherpeton thalassium (strain ATCC 35110 / GB-78) TaxID=517418 RepID=B3QUM2_CHLT3|nr:succinate dehydrogenase, hydrophobic membrane anchor protein [Chloroherpeton thalassium]ACF12928.1 succinate dehydrogenase, membrane subunit, putative [Chloroherpeton thalassium ATCC 35110]
MEKRAAKQSGAFGWFFQRISGMLLLATLIGHFWVQHMPTDALSNPEEYRAIRQAYMEKYPEYKAAVEHGKISEARAGEHLITYEKVTTRLSNPIWKIFDLLFLIFGLYHGMNGLLNIIDDYVRHTGLRLTLVSFCWVLAALLLVQGGLTVITAGVYQPPLGLENILSGLALK